MKGGIFRKRVRLDDVLMSTELITKAWQLSMVLLELDSVLASQVVLEAIELTDTHHWKLSYSHLTSRKHRNKLIFDKTMLLQYFIYERTQKYEIEQEQEHLSGKRCLHKQTIITRYIKHLLLESTRNRSFSVTIAICRLLYDYRQSHASTIYESLTQDCGPDKSDDQYRECKLDLMLKMKQRFPNFLTFSAGSSQKKRFELYENQTSMAGFVRQCLNFFTPWESFCILPAQLAGPRPLIAPLKFESSNPDDEHPIEKARIHTVIHPQCFSRFIEALGYSSPDERLAMPQLSIPTDGNTPPPVDLNSPPIPTSEELNTLRDLIEHQRHRRQQCSPNELAIVVDGIQRESLALGKTTSAQIGLREEDNLVQVFAKEEDGDILLSTLSLRFHRVPGWKSCLRLEGGQKISITVLTNESTRTGSIPASTLEITYRETNLIRAGTLLLRRRMYGASQLLAWGRAWARTSINSANPNKWVGQLNNHRSIFYGAGSFLSLVLVLLVFGAIRLMHKEAEAIQQARSESATKVAELEVKLLQARQRLGEAILARSEKATEIAGLRDGTAELNDKLRESRQGLAEAKLENGRLQIRLNEATQQAESERASEIARRAEIAKLNAELKQSWLELGEAKLENGKSRSGRRVYEFQKELAKANKEKEELQSKTEELQSKLEDANARSYGRTGGGRERPPL